MDCKSVRLLALASVEEKDENEVKNAGRSQNECIKETINKIGIKVIISDLIRIFPISIA